MSAVIASTLYDPSSHVNVLTHSLPIIEIIISESVSFVSAQLTSGLSLKDCQEKVQVTQTSNDFNRDVEAPVPFRWTTNPRKKKKNEGISMYSFILRCIPSPSIHLCSDRGLTVEDYRVIASISWSTCCHFALTHIQYCLRLKCQSSYH